MNRVSNNQILLAHNCVSSQFDESPVFDVLSVDFASFQYLSAMSYAKHAIHARTDQQMKGSGSVQFSSLDALFLMRKQLLLAKIQLRAARSAAPQNELW